jgi:hypothetical protein
MIVAYAAALTVILSVAIYGFDYYTLGAAERPYSPKHILLKPSGAIGIKLGLIGLGMFFVIFLYPLRKRWKWLSQQGNTKHWMDFHVLLGIAAPFVIALHASFKFRGFAGMAFWIMTAVALSGVVGRYLYAQVPRRVTAAEVSLKESHELQETYTTELSSQYLLRKSELQALFRVPTASEVAQMPMASALGCMVWLDLTRPFAVARLRRKTLTAWQTFLTLGGLFRTGNIELEKAVEIARTQAWLAKRLAFLSRAEKLFHLWHVVHKPFSYSFAVLAIVHIGVVWMLGYL